MRLDHLLQEVASARKSGRLFLLSQQLGSAASATVMMGHGTGENEVWNEVWMRLCCLAQELVSAACGMS